MKNRINKLIALGAIVCGLSAGADAQNVPAAPGVQATPAEAQVAKMSPEQRVEMRVGRMKTNLNLTDDQTAKVKTLLMAEVDARSSGDKQKMKDARDKTTSEMSKILTPDQMTKYNQMAQGGRMRMNSNQQEK